ncbi:coiled-coil and C2 domain-containing protein 2A-like [Paramacrobiotus metropolitanus]|uniref:coiled-coil and C2 domain-containing protein 2A-like n=1 Tax=Paramacrobiotus metropolitanus TaxID=2943436 RepID=UPI002445E78B|nr:coiled-coil and C2 domain-containing protein 2A-like [Paramacrobiotus metropolitanus]XP_055354609.1 coiled-coil and C2 domain-containing protein 2A-like [Paramacrobiotus metropolitanus]
MENGRTASKPRRVRFSDSIADVDRENGTILKTMEKQTESEDSSYEFFTKDWSNVVAAAAGSSTDHENTQGPSHLESKRSIVTYLSPFLLESPKKAGRGEKILYFPSSTRPKMGEYLESTSPIFQEEQGLYVGKRPQVATANQNAMENRMVKEKAFHMIDQDWRLKALPDPANLKGTRCHVEHAVESQKNVIVEGSPLNNNALTLRTNSAQRLELILEIVLVEFYHHFLFSVEHMLARRLQDQYKGYQALLEENPSCYIKDKINGLKINLISLQKQAENGLSDDLKVRIKMCLQSLLSHREKLDNAIRSTRLAMVELLRTWTQLKLLRVRNGFTCTPFQLVLHSKNRDKTVDMDTYHNDIEDELSEKEMLFMINYSSLQENYRIQLSEWQTNMDMWKAACETVERNAQNMSQLAEELLRLANSPEPVPPVAPGLFESRTEATQIQERVVRSRRPPGEAELIPELRKDLLPSENSVCSTGERLRRADLSRQKIFLRVVINEQEVCRTSAYNLHDEFKVIIGKKFSFLAEFIPETIKIEVYEEQGFLNRLIAETFVAVPDEKWDASIAPFNSVEFASADKVTTGNAGVGSGTSVTVDAGAEPAIFYTNGTIRCRVAWVPESAKKIAQSRVKLGSSELLDALGARGRRDYKKLAEWAQSAQLDPNDPSNADLIAYLKTAEQSASSNFFRLEQLQQEFDFVSAESIAENRRFRLLQLRDRQVPEFANLKMIPANDNEIPANIFDKYTFGRRQEAVSLLGVSGINQKAHASLLQNLREYISYTVRSVQDTYTYEDMVNEESILNIGKFFSILAGFWKPRRRLMPVRKQQKMISLKQAAHTEMRLIVRILKAENLPRRQKTDRTPTAPMMESTTQERISPTPATNKIDEPVPLRAFATAHFAGQEGKLHVVESTDPVWNGQIVFRLNPTAKSSVQFLQQELEIHFFDEVAVDVLEDNTLRESHIYQRLDRRWLGSLTFPFSALYTTSKIDGTFTLSSPPVLLGYSTVTTSRASVFVALDPPLLPPAPFLLSRLESIEDDRDVQNVEAWTARLRKQFPDRLIRPLVVNTEAKSCLLTRFIHPLNPPPQILFDTTITRDKMNVVARFVSLIPDVPDTLIFPEAVDIWSTNDQFLALLCGDDEEHALLLLSYFLFFKVQAYLLLGQTVGGGPGAFVLCRVQSSDVFSIWDARNGKSYRVTDPECPVTAIGMVANNENIWANVQQYSKAHEMQWQLHLAAHWKPLWSSSKERPANIFTLQPETFTYIDTPAHRKHELEIVLTNKITVAIMEKRSRYVTRWNVECSRRLYHLLDTMEVDRNKADAAQYHEQQLRDLLLLYDIYGFPLNLSLGNPDDVVDAVISTGIHQVDSNDLELSLAVNFTLYPHSVVSVWIYLAVLKRTVP